MGDRNRSIQMTDSEPENGVRIAYRVDGLTDAPVLILSNSNGTTLHMWDRQIAELAGHFRVIRYDTRGHGASRQTDPREHIFLSGSAR